MSQTQTSSLRIQSSYLHILFGNDLTTKDKVKLKTQGFDHVFLFVTDTARINAVLFNPKRFNIRTEDYIRKHFKVGVGLPVVVGIDKKKAFEFVSEHAENGGFYSKGIFRERVLEYADKRDQEWKDREIERLKQELEKKTTPANVTNITNIIIPKIYSGVKINPLGQEDLSSYGLEDLLSILNPERDTSAGDAMRRLITKIHSDSRHPENQNIHITRRPDNFPTCIVYFAEGWCIDKPLDHVMKYICATNIRFMQQVWDQNEDDFPKDKITDSRNFYDAMSNPRADYLIRETARTLYSLTSTNISSVPQSPAPQAITGPDAISVPGKLRTRSPFTHKPRPPRPLFSNRA